MPVSDALQKSASGLRTAGGDSCRSYAVSHFSAPKNRSIGAGVLLRVSMRILTTLALWLLPLTAVQAKDRIPAPIAVVNFRGEEIPLYAPPHLISPRKYVAPQYPEGERNARIEGKVVLTLLIGADGKVLEVEVVSSDPEPSFGAAARKAALQWRYTPVQRNGKAMKFIVRQPVDFTLER